MMDVIVAGAGAVGSAALYQLARRGVKALAFDRFHPPHDRGSSHGETRITRLALGEGEHYVPFVRRSHEIWRELESETGETLLRQVGGLIYGRQSRRTRTHGADDFLNTTIAAALHYGIAHEVINSAEIASRFPPFKLQGDEWGYYEPEAGYVHPEACIAAQLKLARRHGAALQTSERVLRWETNGSSVIVDTDRGRYEAGHLILCAGPWLAEMPFLQRRAQIFRQVLFWFETEEPPDDFAPERMPIFIRVPDAETEMFYGFPAVNGPGGGIKIAREQYDAPGSPDAVSAAVSQAEVEKMHAVASPYLRISSRCLRALDCKYTVTPDFHFIIDHHPDSDRVWFASACSGHGFKHSAAVGEALAEMAATGQTKLDLRQFRMDRFDKATGK
jgi:sarcosine oxidase